MGFIRSVMHSSIHWAPTLYQHHALQVGGTSLHGDDTLAVYLLAQLHTGKWEPEPGLTFSSQDFPSGPVAEIP